MKSFLLGIIGGCITIIICICISLCIHKQSQVFNPIHIVTSNYEVNDTTISNITSFEIKEKLKEIEELKAKGVLLTPQEYTAHVESFYNNIIAILIALLAAFSLVTYFHLRFLAKEEVQNQVKDFVKSSPEVKQIIQEIVGGKIDDEFYEEFVKKDDLKSVISDEMQKMSTKYNVEDDSELGNTKSYELGNTKVEERK